MGSLLGGNKQDVEFIVADNAHLPFRKGVFDTAVCVHGMAWESRELKRVLRKGGEYIQSYLGQLSIHKKETLSSSFKSEAARLLKLVHEKYGV